MLSSTLVIFSCISTILSSTLVVLVVLVSLNSYLSSISSILSCTGKS